MDNLKLKLKQYPSHHPVSHHIYEKWLQNGHFMRWMAKKAYIYVELCVNLSYTGSFIRKVPLAHFAVCFAFRIILNLPLPMYARGQLLMG